MFSQLIFVAKYILGKDVPGGALAPYPDDTFVISHPRSGNTWIRYLITNLKHPEAPASFDLMERTIPDTTAQSRRFLKRVPRPRLIKCHRSFDPRVKRLIYIVRDPRDVAISFYHFQRKYRIVEEGFPLERYVELFVAGEVSDFGSWGEHVGSWLAARFPSPNFLLIRYEDLETETARELAKIASFLGIKADSERLAQAIERSSADRMRKREAAEHETWVATRGKRKEVPFFGPAKAGNWQSVLSKEAVTTIESAWGGLMHSLGYELTLGEINSPSLPWLSIASPSNGSVSRRSAEVESAHSEQGSTHER